MLAANGDLPGRESRIKGLRVRVLILSAAPQRTQET